MADGDIEGRRRSVVPGELVEVRVFGKTITLNVDADIGVGGRLWNASLVLLDYFQDNLPKDFFCEKHNGIYRQGKRVLELGAGVGLVGIALAHAGAHVICSDMPQVLPVLERNVMSCSTNSEAAISEKFGSIRAVSLVWGESGWSQSEVGRVLEVEGDFDIVVGSEIVYYSSSHDDLMWTLRRTLRKGAVAYMTFKDRFYDCRGFFTRLAAADDRRRFLVEEVESFDTLGVDELCLYKITSLQPIAA